jgi:hypothetical protein
VPVDNKVIEYVDRIIEKPIEIIKYEVIEKPA